MGYYDGNTVTALWNYAQFYAMNDNSYGTNFGPSTVGALNLISGQTNGIVATENGPSSDWVDDGNGGLTTIGDPDPIDDVCATSTGDKVRMGGPNIGDLLNTAGITWGFFEGGFNLLDHQLNGTTGCMRSTTSAVTGVTKADYIPHHQPSSNITPDDQHQAHPAELGSAHRPNDPANHQYDIKTSSVQ